MARKKNSKSRTLTHDDIMHASVRVDPELRRRSELLWEDRSPSSRGPKAGFTPDEVALAAVEIAGEAVGLQMGLSFAGFFDPDSGQINAVSRLLNTLSLAAFVAINGPLLLLAAAVRSFEVIPPATALTDWLVRVDPAGLGASLFGLGLTIALPFMALLLFTNLMLGIVSRVAPQLNIFAIGFPVTIGAGLALLALGLPLLQGPFESIFERVFSTLRL